MPLLRAALVAAIAALPFSVVGCGNGTEADKIGVGAQCAVNGDCKNNLTCLAFKGGYCGLEGCTKDADCPAGSACVTHSDAKNYCFRICVDKPECNLNRDPVNESNCSSNITFVETPKGRKACVPPA